MIRPKRGAGVWYAYDLTAIHNYTGKKFKQSYYEDEVEVLRIDAETLHKLGYTDIKIIEREWHKNKTRRY